MFCQTASQMTIPLLSRQVLSSPRAALPLSILVLLNRWQIQVLFIYL